MPWEEPHSFLDVGQSRLAYWRFGRGPDLVFIHGWPLCAATFRNVLPTLTDSFTCHLVDLPGAGRTESVSDAPRDFLGYPETVRRAIDVLGLRRYGLVAHDSGGFVARHVAAGDERVAGLVLGNTEIPGHRPWLVLAYAQCLKLPGGVSLLMALMRSRIVRRSALGLGGCFADKACIDGEFHDLIVRPLLESPDAAEGVASPMRKMRFSAFEELPAVHARIKAPVRLVWGARDRFFPIDRARPMLRQFGGPADLVEIPDGKLFIQEDRASVFAGHAKAFLLGCFAARGSAAAVAHDARPAMA